MDTPARAATVAIETGAGLLVLLAMAEDPALKCQGKRLPS